MWRGLMPSPYASPLVHTLRGKDTRQALRCPRNWTRRGPHPGPPILLGLSALSPALPLVVMSHLTPTW